MSLQPMYEGSAVSDVYAVMRNEGFRLVAVHERYRASNGGLLQADALFCAEKERVR